MKIILCLLVLLIFAVNANASPLLDQNSFEYLGAFRVPLDMNGTGGNHLQYGGSAIGYNYTGNSLYIIGHDTYQQMGEISIPSPVISSNLNNLNRATTIQNLTDFSEGENLQNLTYNGSAVSCAGRVGGVIQYNTTTLLGTVFAYSDGGHAAVRSHFISGVDIDALGDFEGFYPVGEKPTPVPQAGFIAGYLSKTPTTWTSYINGSVMMGQGCLPIIGRTSYGPALFSYDPENMSFSDNGTVEALLYYPSTNQTIGTYTSTRTLYNLGTKIIGMTPINGTDTVVYIGTTGAGQAFYGYGTNNKSEHNNTPSSAYPNNLCMGSPMAAGTHPCVYDPINTAKGGHAYPYSDYMWLYDLDDLKSVKNGTNEPWEIIPYKTFDINYSFVPERKSPTSGAAAYDEINNRLYTVQTHGDATRPLIHVWQINSSNVTDTIPPDTIIAFEDGTETNSSDVDFVVVGTDLNVTLECKMDSESYAACTMFKSYTGLSTGSHTFTTRATDSDGNVDASPAIFDFSVTVACAPGDNFTVINSTHIEACNCTQEYVQYAVDNATDGMTVLVPAGECNWSSWMSITKRITLQGSGMYSTVITRNGTAIYMRSDGLRITDMGFITHVNNIYSVHAKGKNWRVDHCNFRNVANGKAYLATDGYNTNDYPTGVIDNNVFENFCVDVEGCGNFDTISATWNKALNLGTVDAVYVENCTFSRDNTERRNAMDGNRGAKSVCRYNNISDGHVEAHSLQSDGERAYRKWEIYGNILLSSSEQFRPMRIIGGTGVIFNNSISGDWSNRHMDFYNRRSYQSIGAAGLCDGNSTWDGNEDATGYPCRDQIGRSTDAYIFDKNNPPYPSQEFVPAYLWENRDLGLAGDSYDIMGVDITNNASQHIKSDRDYYNEVTLFNGTTGTGNGTFSSMPSTCTVGVGYWATDVGEWNSENSGADGTLYICTSSNTWDAYYAPFDYPHPLVSGTPGVSLLSPENMDSTTVTTINFTCCVIDSGNLTNVTLYGSWNSGWHANETISINGSYNETMFTKTLTSGTYEWNCLAYAEDGNSDWANLNYSVTIESGGFVPSNSKSYYNILAPIRNVVNSSGYYKWDRPLTSNDTECNFRIGVTI